MTARTRVMNAIKQGVSDVDAIATWLDLDRQQVMNALSKLVDAKKVRKDGRKYVENTRPALSEAWK